MDLIYTNAKGVDQGVLSSHFFDLSYGAEENDFELILGTNEAMLEYGAFIYMEGTEYGGMVDGLKANTNSDAITYTGRTWHGILNSKIIQPNAGADYYTGAGDANNILSKLIDRLGLSDLFVVSKELSGVSIYFYQFNRFCKGYDGITAMLAANNAKLKIVWKDRKIHLSAEPMTDYTKSPVDGDIAALTVEHHEKKVNHLICLGKGELAAREVIHLYADQFGRIGDVQYYFGLDEICETYDNSNSDDLRNDGIAKLTELRNIDTAEIHLPQTEGKVYDIGDIVGATEHKSRISVAEKVTQKIVKINNGVVSTEYKTGR